jgi:hypothetical protein
MLPFDQRRAMPLNNKRRQGRSPVPVFQKWQNVNGSLGGLLYPGRGRSPAAPFLLYSAEIPMKIGTLLTTVILSLSAVGGGLAVYVAATKHDTMNKISVAQSRLEIVRAVGDIPRYLNPERGFATNIMFGPAVVEQKQRTELGTYREQTDGAVEKMDQVRKTSVDALDDGADIVAKMGDLRTQFDCPSHRDR